MASLRIQLAKEGGGDAHSRPKSPRSHPNQAKLREAIAENKLDKVQSIFAEAAEEAKKELLHGSICAAITHEASPEILRYLLDQGGDPNETSPSALHPLHIAAAQGNVALATVLLEHGAVVNVKSEKKRRLADSVDPHAGTYPLHLAVERGRREMVELLVTHGADVNLKNDYYNATPLCEAAKQKDLEMVKIMVEKGTNVDLNKTNRSGATALYIASSEGEEEMVKYLLQKGADPSIVSGLRKTAKEVAKTEAIAALFDQVDTSSS